MSRRQWKEHLQARTSESQHSDAAYWQPPLVVKKDAYVASYKLDRALVDYEHVRKICKASPDSHTRLGGPSGVEVASYQILCSPRPLVGVWDLAGKHSPEQ